MDTTIYIEPCDDERSPNFSIPSECYDEIEDDRVTRKILFIIGILLLVIPAWLCCCIFDVAANGRSTHYPGTYSYSHTYGLGVGGGGSNSGGGGGC
jgi:hypothetical protein